MHIFKVVSVIIFIASLGLNVYFIVRGNSDSESVRKLEAGIASAQERSIRAEKRSQHLENLIAHGAEIIRGLGKENIQLIEEIARISDENQRVRNTLRDAIERVYSVDSGIDSIEARVERIISLVGIIEKLYWNSGN